jgi:hypothetical protein
MKDGELAVECHVSWRNISIALIDLIVSVMACGC